MHQWNMNNSSNLMIFVCSWLFLNVGVHAQIPWIFQGPRDQAVLQGSPVSFLCRAAHANSVVWKKNGRELTEKDSEIYHITRCTDGFRYYGSVLRIKEAMLGRDNAHYECVAMSLIEGFRNMNDSAQAGLYVYEEDEVPPGFPVITEVSPSIDVLRGGTAVLKCAATGTPTPVIRWNVNKMPIELSLSEKNRWYSILNTTLASDTLQISNFSADHVAGYECIAENDVGTQFAQDFPTVSIRREPILFVNTPPPVVRVKQGDDLNLTCEAAADPMPTLTWFKDPGTRITPDDPLPIGKAVLELKKIQKAKNYTCIAENGINSLGIRTATQVQIFNAL